MRLKIIVILALLLFGSLAVRGQTGGTPPPPGVVNKQTGATYTLQSSDRSRLVTFTNAGAIAVTLPKFPTGWYCWVSNRGAGTLTITPSTGTVDGAASLALTTNQGLMLASDGTNYFTASRGKETSLGDVSGPGSATAGDISTFSGTTGKIIQDSGVSISTDGTFASNSDLKLPTEKAVKTYADTKAPLASPVFTGTPLAPTPSATDNSTKLATTAYVTTGISNAIAAVNPAVAVQAASAAILPNSPTYNNGVAGIGAFITTLTLNTPLVVDGYTPSLSDRILVKNESGGGGLGAAKNGAYTVTQVSGVGLAWILTRALDYNQPSDMNNTGAIPVVNGTVNTATSWVQTSQVTTVGTDAVTFTQFSINPATEVTSAGGTINQLAWFAATGQAVSGLATANNGVLITSGGGVPSISSTLPSGIILVAPALGTPVSGTLTNATGLPVAGLSNLGTGVGTFLVTPSSANLASALTDETGTLKAVFSDAPTFTTSITDPLVTGGTGASSSLELRSTSGSGTSDFIKFTVHTTGGTEAGRFTTSGGLNVGATGDIAAGTINANVGFTVAGAATTGTILRGDGTKYLGTTATYPATTTINQLLYSSSASVIGGLATANNAVLVTSSGGVPSVAAPSANLQVSSSVLDTIQGIQTTSTPRFARLGLNQAADGTASLAATQTSLGVTSTDGLIVQNTTAAANGAQQWSPRLRLTAQQWDTTDSASKQQDWIMEVQPLQSSVDNSQLMISSQGAHIAGYQSLFGILFNGSVGNPSYFFNAPAAHNPNIVFQAAGVSKWYIRNLGTSSDQLDIINSDANSNASRFQMTQAGAISNITSIALVGKIPTYNNVNTAGWGVPAIYSAPAISATKTANFTVLTFTPAAAAAVYRVGGVITTTSATNTGTVQFTLDYVDSQGTTHTADIIPLIDAAGVMATTKTGASKEFHAPDWQFSINNSATNIVLKVVITGSVSYTVVGTIEQIQ